MLCIEVLLFLLLAHPPEWWTALGLGLAALCSAFVSTEMS